MPKSFPSKTPDAVIIPDLSSKSQIQKGSLAVKIIIINLDLLFYQYLARSKLWMAVCMTLAVKCLISFFPHVFLSINIILQTRKNAVVTSISPMSLGIFKLIQKLLSNLFIMASICCHSLGIRRITI